MKTDHYVVICDLIHLQHFTSKYFLFANLHLPISQKLTRSFFEFEMTLQYLHVSIKFGTNTIYRHIVLNRKHEDKCREKLDNFKSSEFPTVKIPKWQNQDLEVQNWQNEPKLVTLTFQYVCLLQFSETFLFVSYTIEHNKTESQVHSIAALVVAGLHYYAFYIIVAS